MNKNLGKKNAESTQKNAEVRENYAKDFEYGSENCGFS